MTRFVRVAAMTDLPVGRGRTVFAEGRSFALFVVGGEVFALDDACPHAGSSLGSGTLDGGYVACRAHGLRFDVRTGCMRGADGLRAKPYPVQVANGEVSIGVDATTGAPTGPASGPSW